MEQGQTLLQENSMAIITPSFTSPLPVQNFIPHLDEIRNGLGQLQGG